MKRNIFSVALLLLLSVSGCHNFGPVDPNKEYEYPAKTHTIAEFLSEFMTERGVMFPVRTRSGGDGQDVPANIGLFSVDTIPQGGDDIVVHGRVISEDVAGNLYKSLVIQDLEDPTQGLRVSVDAGSLSGLYPIGTVIALRCNGLAVGKYANQPQIAVPSYNNNTNANKPEEKVGWAPGRIPTPLFHKAVSVVEFDKDSKEVATTMTIDEIVSVLGDNDKIQKLNGRLVTIENIFFNQTYDKYGVAEPLTENHPETGGKDYSESSHVFAPSTYAVGHPQSRYIEDLNNSANTFLVSSSEYAKFAHVIIPEAEYTGSITGIVSFYWDNARYDADKTNWSITIRSLDDLKLVNDEGKAWEPKYYGEK